MSSFSNNNVFQKASCLTNNNTPTFFKLNIDNTKNNSSNSFNSSINWPMIDSNNNNINPFLLNKKENNNPFSINNNNLNNNNQCNNYNNNNNSQLNNFERGINFVNNGNSNMNFFSNNNNDLNKQNLNSNLNSNSFMMKENNNNFITNPFILNINSQNSFSVNNNLNKKNTSNYSQSFISLNNPFSQNNNNYNNYNNNNCNNSTSNLNQKSFNNNFINSNSNINTYNNENNCIPNNYYSSSNNVSNVCNQNNSIIQNNSYNQNNNMRNNSYLNNQMNDNIGNNYSNQNNYYNTQFQNQLNTNLNQVKNNNQINFISNNQNQNLNCDNNITNKNIISDNFIQNTNQTMFPNLLNNNNFEQDTISYMNSFSQFYGNYPSLNNKYIPINFINLIEEKSKEKEISNNKIINITFIKENEINKINHDENIKLFIQDLKSNKIKKGIEKFNNYNNNYSPNFFQFPNFNQYKKNKNRKLKIQNIKETIPKITLKPNTKLTLIPKQAKQFFIESADLRQNNKDNEKTKLKIESLSNENTRDKFKHPIGNTPEKLKIEFNLININSYIPICTKYQLNPKIESLSVMREIDLQSINNFSILSNDIKIIFKKPVNLINLNLDKFIISNNYDISIEDDKLKKILGPVIIEIYDVFLDVNNNEVILNSILSKFNTNEYKYNSEFKILSFETDLNKIIN